MHAAHCCRAGYSYQQRHAIRDEKTIFPQLGGAADGCVMIETFFQEGESILDSVTAVTSFGLALWQNAFDSRVVVEWMKVMSRLPVSFFRGGLH